MPFSLFPTLCLSLCPSFSVPLSATNDKTRHITDASVFDDAMLQLNKPRPYTGFFVLLSHPETPTLVRLQIKQKKQKDDYACMQQCRYA